MFERFCPHLREPIRPDVRRLDVLKLAWNCLCEEQHADRGRLLVTRLVDQRAPLHGYDLVEHELLDAAPLLHDLEGVVRCCGFQKHSHRLIERSGRLDSCHLKPVSWPSLPALTARVPLDISDYDLLLDSDDHVLLTRLVGTLCVAQRLERGKKADIADVIAAWTDWQLRLTLISDGSPKFEL